MMQKVFFGPTHTPAPSTYDLSMREKLIMGLLTVAIVVLGLFPQPVIDLLKPLAQRLSITTIQHPDTNDLTDSQDANN
ncbi:NADH:ubiquinone oxidoreductase subunit M [compost metagenome]